MLAAASAATASASTNTALASFYVRSHFVLVHDRIITIVVTASAGVGFASHCMPWYE